MESNEKIIGQIRQQAMLPLFYHDEAAACVDITKALYAGGVRVIEFTNRGPQAMANFKQLVQLRESSLKDLVLAVGTIATGEQATRFIEAGADFLISPYFDVDVCDAAYMHKKLWIPGCMTPTEIHAARNAGCKLVKIFPGNVLGPSFVSGVKEVFPDVLMMPTGGVELDNENLAAWFKAGVCAVGMGSKLLSKALLTSKDFSQLERITSDALKIVQQARN